MSSYPPQNLYLSIYLKVPKPHPLKYYFLAAEMVLLVAKSRNLSSGIAVLVLFLCFALNVFCDDSAMVSVPLGFAINGVDRSRNWVSKNGVFAFGFLGREDLDSSQVGVWYNLGNASVNLAVWNVGGGLKVSVNSTIRLDSDGSLVLVQNQNGGIVWSSDTSGLGIRKASLLDNGNLVLLDEEDKVLWESFSSPTDTLLPGQSLSYPQTLRAFSTESTISFYSLVISKNGVLQLEWEHNVTYWRSPIGSKVARFGGDGVLGLYDETNNVVWSVSSKDSGDLSLSESLRRLSLDQDGNLRIYSWDNVSREWKAGWQAVNDQCDVFGSCGKFSVCGHNLSGSVCECLYSQPLSSDSSLSGADSGSSSECRKMVDLANCRMRTSMMPVKQTVLYGLYPPNDVKMFLGERDCLNYCSNDSSCIAVTSMNDGSGLCTVKRTVYISGYNSHTVSATSYLKVCSAPQAVATQNVIPRDNSGLLFSSVGQGKSGGASIRVFIGAIALIVFITVIFVMSTEVFVFWIMRRRGEIKAQTRIPFGKDAQMNPHYSALIRLDFEEVKVLTDNFGTPLGPSHFRGTLPNRTLVVAKMLNDVVVSEKEFRFAVSTLGGTHHRNLVSIKGFCFEPKQKLLLYEYVPNGSLDKWLLGDDNDVGRKRHWQEGLHIAVGIARAIHYLHTECQQCINHGNLRLENVLLDENLVPKVTDFGLRTLLYKDAPSSSETPSEKDIYNLGTMLLQIVTCKRDVSANRDNVHEILDDLLRPDGKFVIESEDSRAVERVVKIAIWCMQNQPFLRPSISEVVKVLEGTLSVDSPPAGFMLQHQHHQSIDVGEISMEKEEE